MKFSSTPPTEPGFYAWKRNENSRVEAIHLVEDPESLSPSRLHLRDFNHDPYGLWCRLYPSGELVPKEEVEKAFREGVERGRTMDGLYISQDALWLSSRARKVVEGMSK